jgi:hypothetical protein
MLRIINVWFCYRCCTTTPCCDMRLIDKVSLLLLLLLLLPANADVPRRQGHQAGPVVCSLKRLRCNG